MTTLLVGFHGGERSGAINNIRAFADGQAPYDLLAESPQKLTELRKFLFDPNVGYRLYVANALKTESQILLYSGVRPVKGNQWRCEGVYVSDKLSHPFDVIFAFGGYMFVSSQDTKQVTYYTGAGAKGETFGPVFTTLRGLAYDPDRKQLYIADAGDRKANLGYVGVFGSDAKPRNPPIKVSEPVHLLYDRQHGWLFIGSEREDTVFAWNPANAGAPPIKVVWNQPQEPNLDATAGMALEERGSPAQATLYVASRLGEEILSYPLDFSTGKPEWQPRKASIAVKKSQLKENPEFVGIQGGTYG